MFYHFHPYEPFFKKDTQKIIVGTLPPPRFCTRDFKSNDVDFSYGSQDGLLWKILDVIFDLKLEYLNTKEEIKRRKDFLIRSEKNPKYSTFDFRLQQYEKVFKIFKGKEFPFKLKSFYDRTLIFFFNKSSNFF